VRALDALRVATCVVAQWWAGTTILRASWRGGAVTALELRALGAVTGMSLALLADQLVVNLLGAGWGWLLPVPVALVLAAVRRGTAPAPSADPEWRDGARVLAGTALLLGTGWYWLLPAALCGAVLVCATEPGIATRLGARVARATAAFAAVAILPAAGWGLAGRPATWWIEDSDYGFFEALGWAFARDGLAANPLATGHPIRYHWFVYGWFGLVERVAGTPNWVVMSRAGLLLGSLVVVAVLLALLRRLVASRAAALLGLFGIALFDTFVAWGSGFRLGLVSAASQLVGFAWLFGLGLVLVLRTRTTLTTWPFTALLMAGATGAKISHGVVAAAGLGVATLAAAARERRAWPRVAADAAAAAAAFTGTFVVVHLGAGNLEVAYMRFPESLQGELRDYPGRPTALAGVVMLLGLAGAAAYGVALALARRDGRAEAYPWFAAGAMVAGVLVSVTTSSVFGSQLYFAHSAAALALPAGVAVLARPGVVGLRREAWVAICVGGLVAAVATRAIPSLDSGSLTAILLRLARGATWVVPVGVVVALAATGRVARAAVARGVLVGLAVAGVATGPVNWFEFVRTRYPALFESDVDGRVGSPSLVEATAWMHGHLPRGAVFATNEEGFLGATLSRRTALLVRSDLAARHTRATPARDAQFDERKALQREFAAAPSAALRDRLVAEGVGWFLVRLEPGAAWTSEVGTVRFANAGYAVVELSGP